MAITNHERVGKALELLKEDLDTVALPVTSAWSQGPRR